MDARMRLLLLSAVTYGCAFPEFAFSNDVDAITVEDTTADTTVEMVDTTVAVDTAETTQEVTAESAADTTAIDTAKPETAGTNVTLAAKGGTWRYLDDGTAPSSTSWRGGSGFDDSKWKSGAAQLGFGDGDEKTIITGGVLGDAGADAADSADAPIINFTAYYFRRFFTVTGAADFDEVTVRLLRDDGAVVYLNGTEVIRSNMPSGTITNSTRASTNVVDPEENLYLVFVVPAALLKEGANVLAVEVHQSNSGSNDLSFDLELVGHKP